MIHYRDNAIFIIMIIVNFWILLYIVQNIHTRVLVSQSEIQFDSLLSHTWTSLYNNTCNYRDNCENVLNYRDIRIFIIAQAYVRSVERQ